VYINALFFVLTSYYSLTLKVVITACAVATSCCISDESCQWEKANFDPLQLRHLLTDRPETQI